MELDPNIGKEQPGKEKLFDPFPFIPAEEWLRITGYKLQKGVTLEEADQYQRKLHDVLFKLLSLATLVGKLDTAIPYAPPDKREEMGEKLIQLRAAHEQAQKDYHDVASREESRRFYDVGDPGKENQRVQDNQNEIDTLLAQVDEALN